MRGQANERKLEKVVTMATGIQKSAVTTQADVTLIVVVKTMRQCFVLPLIYCNYTS